MRCFKCYKYGYHRVSCRRHLTCGWCDQRDSDHMEEDFLSEIKCPNCQEIHLTFSRSCDIYKKEKWIMEIKYKRNIMFFADRNIEELYMKVNTYITVALRANPISNNNQSANYQTLDKKLITLQLNNWPKFQEQLKKLTFN